LFSNGIGIITILCKPNMKKLTIFDQDNTDWITFFCNCQNHPIIRQRGKYKKLSAVSHLKQTNKNCCFFLITFVRSKSYNYNQADAKDALYYANFNFNENLYFQSVFGETFQIVLHFEFKLYNNQPRNH
jgi:hypothetical protein